MVDILADTGSDRLLEASDQSKPEAPRTPEPGASLPFDTSATSDPLGVLSGDAFKTASFNLQEEYKKYESKQDDATVQEKQIIEERNAQLKRMSDAEGATAAEMHQWNPQEAAARHTHGLWEQFGSPGFVFAMLASSFTGMPMTNALNAGAAAMNAINKGDMEAYHREFDAWKQNTELAVKRFEMEKTAYSQTDHLYKDKLDEWHAEQLANAARFNDKKAQILLENGLYEPLLQAREQAAKTMENVQAVRDKLDLEHSKHEFVNYLLEDDDGKPLYNLAKHPDIVSDAKMVADLAFETPKTVSQFELREMWMSKEWRDGDHAKHLKMLQDMEAKSKVKENLAALEARDKYAYRADAMKELGINDPEDRRVIDLANKREVNSKKAQTPKEIRLEEEYQDFWKEEREKDPEASKADINSRAEKRAAEARTNRLLRNPLSLYTSMLQKDPKLTPEDVIRLNAHWQKTAAEASTLGKREANVRSVLNEAIGTALLAVQESDKLKRGDIVTLNKIKQGVEKELSHPELGAFFAADKGFKIAYAQTMNRTSVTTDSARASAEEVLNIAKGQAFYKRVIRQLVREMNTVKAGVLAAQEELGFGDGKDVNEPGPHVDIGLPEVADPELAKLLKDSENRLWVYKKKGEKNTTTDGWGTGKVK
jgi:hypothetical protein